MYKWLMSLGRQKRMMFAAVIDNIISRFDDRGKTRVAMMMTMMTVIMMVVVVASSTILKMSVVSIHRYDIQWKDYPQSVVSLSLSLSVCVCVCRCRTRFHSLPCLVLTTAASERVTVKKLTTINGTIPQNSVTYGYTVTTCSIYIYPSHRRYPSHRIASHRIVPSIDDDRGASIHPSVRSFVRSKLCLLYFLFLFLCFESKQKRPPLFYSGRRVG